MQRPGWLAVLVAAVLAALTTWCVALVVLGGGADDSGSDPVGGHADAAGDDRSASGPADSDVARTAPGAGVASPPGSPDAVRVRIAELERELASLRPQRGPRPRAAVPAPDTAGDGAGPTPTPVSPVNLDGVVWGNPDGSIVLPGSILRIVGTKGLQAAASVSAEDARLAAERYAASLRAGTDGSAWVPIALGGPKDRRDVLDPVLDVVRDTNVSPASRAAGLDTLACAGSTAAAPTADDILRTSTDPTLRLAALRTILAAVTAGAPVPPTARYLAMDAAASESEREMAITILARGDPASAVSLVEPMVTSSDAAVRARGIAIMNATRSKVFLPLMIRTLHRDDLGGLAGPLTEAIADTKDRRWSALQLTGEPDTPRTGDYGTAWAAKREEMGRVTIELGYEMAVVADRIRISETLCAGGVASVALRAPGGDWETVWEGTAPAGPATAPRWFEPSIRGTGFATSAVRIVVDTDRVRGWEEIDCVELVGSGRSQWAATATATSSYTD